jgi:hypothetical protein
MISSTTQVMPTIAGGGGKANGSVMSGLREIITGTKLGRHLVRIPGMVPNETICGVRRFHRVVFQRCVRCPPILHESFKKLE